MKQDEEALKLNGACVVISTCLLRVSAAEISHPTKEDKNPSTASTNNRKGGIFRVGHRRLSDQNIFINIVHLNKDNNL